MLVHHFRFHDWGGKSKNIGHIGGLGGTSPVDPGVPPPLRLSILLTKQLPCGASGSDLRLPCHGFLNVCVYCGPWTKWRSITHLT